jgi:hypothetical protein
MVIKLCELCSASRITVFRGMLTSGLAILNASARCFRQRHTDRTPTLLNILVEFGGRRFVSSLLGWSFIARIHGFLMRLTKSPKLAALARSAAKKSSIRSFVEKTEGITRKGAGGASATRARSCSLLNSPESTARAVRERLPVSYYGFHGVEVRNSMNLSDNDWLSWTFLSAEL